MGKYMTPRQYLKKWRQNRIWTHLEWPKHMARLHWCADNCVGNEFLDVGCALGHSTNIMKARHPGDWTGVEFCAKTVAEAAALFPDIAFVHIPDVEGLRSLEADSIVCSEVIEHVKNDSGLLEILFSIAGRRLILTTPHVDAHDPGHVRIYDDKRLAKLLEGYSAEISKDEVFYKIIIER
jgi:trans-aconitate methyltransferase